MYNTIHTKNVIHNSYGQSIIMDNVCPTMDYMDHIVYMDYVDDIVHMDNGLCGSYCPFGLSI